MEQYRIMNDEYTEHFRKLDKKQNEMHDTLKRLKYDTDKNF